MSKKVNKTKKILARLLKGERLTVSQMSKEYSINHPLSIMYHLRKKGYVIKSELVGNPTGRDYNEYWIGA